MCTFVVFDPRGRSFVEAELARLEALVGSVPRTRRFDGLAGLSSPLSRPTLGISWDPSGVTFDRPFDGAERFFYSNESTTVIGATQLEPLGRAISAKPRIDTIAALLHLAPLPERASVYERIHAVPLSARVTVSPRGAVTHRRIVPHALPEVSSPKDAARALRAHFFDAVENAISGTKKVAVMGGGGLDSSGVLAAAVAIARGATEPEVFAIAIDAAGPGDDRPHLRALAKDLGIVPIRLTPRETGACMREALVLDGAPFPWPTGAWELAAARAAKARGADVLLTGAGGDDLMEGDASLLFAAWRDPFARRRDGRRLLGATLLRPLRTMLRRWRGTPDERKRRASPADRLEEYLTAPRFLRVADMRGQLEVATGIRCVEPFFDPSLVRFTLGLPGRWLFSGGRSRGLFREAMRGLLPETLRLRNDKALFEPGLRETLLGAGGHAAFADLASMDRLAALGLVERTNFARDFESLARSEMPGKNWLVVWPAIAVEAFLRGHSE